MKWMNFGEKSRLFCSMAISRLINGYKVSNRVEIRSILIIRHDEIGDMCYTVHLFEMLKKQYPAASITLWIRLLAKKIILHDPFVDVIETERANLKGPFDLIVDLKCSYQTMFYGLKSWPKLRLDKGTIRFRNSFVEHPHEVISNYQVIETLISPVNKSLQPRLYTNESEEKTANDFIAQFNLNNFAILHISSLKELKKWPAANFVKLALYLSDKLKMQVVFTGDKSNVKDIESVQKQLPFITFSTAGNLSLLELAALMKKAALYIGNDSGPLHLAALSGIPCIGLFGPAPPTVFYPLSDRSRVIHHVLECNPCDQIHCVHPENPCIQRITLEEVKSKINELLN